MLKMSMTPYITKKYNTGRNVLTAIPVLGTWKNNASIPYQLTFDEVISYVFLPDGDDPNQPNVFDGTSSGDVVDFNATPLLADIVAVYNEVMKAVSNQVASLTPLGGDGSGGPLLQYTRYVEFNPVSLDVTNLKRLPRHYNKYVIEKDVEVEADNKRSSTKDKKVFKKVKILNPPNSTVFTEFTVAYSGLIPISSSFKEFAPQLILPVIEIVPGQLPGQQQVQVSCMEPFSIVPAANGVVLNNRGQEIIDGVVNMIVGQAGKKTELATFVEGLSRDNEGGFLGDLFSTVGGIANQIGL